VEDFGQQTGEDIERHLFRRFSHLVAVRRFVAGWLALLLLLIAGLLLQTANLSGYYQTLRPVPGGIYSEGILGSFTTANPLFAVNDVDLSVSRLIFAGLFTYNARNQLVGDLASGYRVNDKGNEFTIHLKPGLTWQDGQPLTSADVVFTYQTIQDPDVKSPLLSSWQGVQVSAPDAQTVVFTLPDPLASFPTDLTNGIVPKHLLAKIPAVDLRSADFNTVNPVGAGPFAWGGVQVSGANPATAQEQIGFTPFAQYVRGEPKLHEFVMRAYADVDQLRQAFSQGQLNGVEGLSAVPPSSQVPKDTEVHSLILTAAQMVFFKTSDPLLSDQKVRQALVQAANVPQIIANLGYATAAVREPLLAGQVGYDRKYVQPGFDLAAAQNLLTQDGWVADAKGQRSKNGQPLKITLTVPDTAESHAVSGLLQRDWQALGAKVNLEYLASGDFQDALSGRTYQAVLYGISIGADPDVFVYWDSSQADPRSTNRLNLSEYKNATADTALEAGRTRLDPALRAVKYQPFLQAWQQDLPALGLYQPRLLYLTKGPVAGLIDSQPLNTSADRFDNVQNWTIRQGKVTD
jgi:peptide/nickel transport system substrate-binding protein